MHPSIFVLLSCLSCGFLVGCATPPTPTQQLAIDSGIRVSTMAYVLKDGNAAAQQARATRVLSTTAQVRKQVLATGAVVPDLDALAQWANKLILDDKTISPEDKRLLQAAVMEAIFLAEDTGLVIADIGAANAAQVLKGLDQADRVARTLLGAA
jgi:hypothetical protein